MTWGVLNAAMLLGVLGAAVPVVIHLLNRRRDPIIEWGAMQFLELGRRARQKLKLTEMLLMMARMGLLAVVALALARPYLGGISGGMGALGGGASRDLVIVIDGSASMGRATGGTTARAEALKGARQLVSGLKAGDSVAVLLAGDRVRGVVDPSSFDLAKVDAAIAGLAKVNGRGSSDVPAALAEAFRVLERTQNPDREVVVLGDGQRAGWRPGDLGRWNLVRDLHKRLPVPPRVWAVSFGGGADGTADAPNGSISGVKVSRGLVTPGLPLTVSGVVENAGPGALTRMAELLIDGVPAAGEAQVVGPLPAGGRGRVEFKTVMTAAGSHLLTIRLGGGEDSLASDDEGSAAVEVAAALPVLLVDGEPGREPLSGETDFLRAALAPSGDDAPQVQATVVTLEGFKTSSLQNKSVLVLANVERLDLDQSAAVARFLDSGGGVLVAPGDRLDLAWWNAQSWMPAKLGERTGDFAARKVVAHPAPSTFTGPVLPPFGQGESPAMGEADLFAYRRLEPVAGASVSARLDTGEPWVVEKPQGRGRVLLLAGPLDAEGGTLPVNPDFVPLTHEWAFHLAGGFEPRAVKPGEPLVFDLNPLPDASLTALAVLTPGAERGKAVVVRAAGVARARFEGTHEPGVYQLLLPEPPGGSAYAVVQGDDREGDASPLEPAEAGKLAEGWPLRFEADASRLAAEMSTAAQGGGGGRREVWRWLVLAALGALCVEIYLTRRLVRGQGLA